ncbi:unnamed protein product [Adineta steineri]|uniref:EGF-like domain-containing protein n=1 Tax=Adineta steineri TaxID=433720 RepID=A0A814UPY4_9BILA|nr:unnamed protein product [Adineta steineri]CAF1178545.1 unnamed protein product [Adineta steineri]
MPSIIVPLVFVFLTNFLIQPSVCVLPPDLPNVELDDITSLQYEFPSMIGKMKMLVNQLHCPKGWEHFGGSCYYLSKIKSISTQANQTCSTLNSNLMQIRNTIELFYASYILTKNNLSTLMIHIEPNLLKGILTDDQDQWQLMKNKFRKLFIRDYKLKEKFIDELNAAGLRISKRSKKIKQTVRNSDTYNHYNNERNDEYEYDNLNLADEKQMNDIQGICDRLEWNFINNGSTVYILKTSLISNKMICSLSDVESNIEYKHICENVLNFCFENNKCGKHGRCINTLSDFKCSCSFLYDGLLCERISSQGRQIIIGLIVIFVLYGLSIQPTRRGLVFIVRACIKCRFKKHQHKKRNKENNTENHEEEQELHNINQSRQIVSVEKRRLTLLETSPRNKRSPIRLIWVCGLSIFFLTLLLCLTATIQLTLFKHDTVKLETKCKILSNNKMSTYALASLALALILIFSWTIKRENKCLHLRLISPIEPFRIENRFTTATVFGLLAFELLQKFEGLLFNGMNLLNDGILTALLEIVTIALIGLRYYPILASLQLRNIIGRFLICLYILGNIIYTIIREGACMSSLPISKYDSISKETKLPIELNTEFFIIFGLLKNIPYFILLSYITAELFVRFAYDSIYIPIKKKQSVWSSPITQSDEYSFAKYYVTKLFRRNPSFNQQVYSKDESYIKKCLHSIYHWNNDFHFTTIAICTYTVAIIFLYYLSYTIILRYISFVNYYTGTIFNINKTFYLYSLEFIVISAVITIGIISLQLFNGIKNYKEHKLQLFKGIYVDIPPAVNLKSNTILLKSLSYFGFLVGHMACSFIIFFHLIIFIFYAIHIISLHMPYIELLLNVIVPVFILYLLIMVGRSTVEKYFFIQNMKEEKVYENFLYFSFIIDCFLGFVSCIIRLIKAIFLNIIYMSRLDCSLHGRSTEKLDLGFTVYISYLHMEVAHTNPVMLAFCSLLYDNIVQRRPKFDDDDESLSRKTIVHTQKARGLHEIRRYRQSRFRWFLAYTLIHNPYLFGLRHQREISVNAQQDNTYLSTDDNSQRLLNNLPSLSTFNVSEI